MMVSFAVKIVKLESQSCSLVADQPQHVTSIVPVTPISHSAGTAATTAEKVPGLLKALGDVPSSLCVVGQGA